MKRVKTRKNFRISNPIGFSLFVAGCLLALGLLATLITLGVGYGDDIVKWAQAKIQGTVDDINEQPTFSPVPTDVPTFTPEPIETPAVGTPAPPSQTPTPEPIGSVEDTPEPTQDPSAPLYGFTIGVDPGRDSSSSYKEEVAFNLEFAQGLASYLEEHGATVVLSREDNDVRIREAARGQLFKAADCDIAIEVRCNHFDKRSSGFHVRYNKSKTYARELADAYHEVTGIRFQSNKKNGIEQNSNSLIQSCGCPCVRLYLGNWDNESDRATFSNEATQQKIFEAIMRVLAGQLKTE